MARFRTAGSGMPHAWTQPAESGRRRHPCKPGARSPTRRRPADGTPFREERLSPRARILLAEDESSLRKVLSLVLTRAGYEVLAAASGEELISTLAAHGSPQAPPVMDLVITDVRLPDMNGRELIRRLARRLAVPAVLYISGAPFQESDSARGVATGATAYLNKPFDLSEFLRVIETLLAGGPAPAPEPVT